MEHFRHSVNLVLRSRVGSTVLVFAYSEGAGHSVLGIPRSGRVRRRRARQWAHTIHPSARSSDPSVRPNGLRVD